MMVKKLLKRVHLVATIWFMACLGYLLAIALRQAGFNWWVIFPLSGPSAVVAFLLVSLYLYAFFRGADGSRYIEVEHPLTSSDCYLAFYVSTPLLGALTALLASADAPAISKVLFSVAVGTLAATFLVWIIIDPLAGAIEMLLPASRKHRAERMAEREQTHALTNA